MTDRGLSSTLSTLYSMKEGGVRVPLCPSLLVSFSLSREQKGLCLPLSYPLSIFFFFFFSPNCSIPLFVSEGSPIIIRLYHIPPSLSDSSHFLPFSSHFHSLIRASLPPIQPHFRNDPNDGARDNRYERGAREGSISAFDSLFYSMFSQENGASSASPNGKSSSEGSSEEAPSLPLSTRIHNGLNSAWQTIPEDIKWVLSLSHTHSISLSEEKVAARFPPFLEKRETSLFVCALPPILCSLFTHLRCLPERSDYDGTFYSIVCLSLLRVAFLKESVRSSNSV